MKTFCLLRCEPYAFLAMSRGFESRRDYTLRYRYALGNNNRSGLLKVNNTSRNITMQGTGDWANWRMTDVAITLMPGSDNVIRFQSTGQDFGNLDRIIILPYKTEEPTYVLPVNESEEFLFRNYPNPFNSETVIEYNVPQSGTVTLRVIDMLGHTVTELVNRNQQAGHYRAVWNGKDDAGRSVGTGIYFYELITEKYRSIKRMILIR